jgi:alkylhydroperoxidase/carboxymuconolactone decarboxylase family protein YurZ
MPEPTPIAVPAQLAALENAFPGIVAALRDARLAGEAGSSLTEREIELVRLGVMIAIDAPQASFTPHVERALAGSVTSEDIMAVAAALATIVGVPKLLATLPKLAEALEA